MAQEREIFINLMTTPEKALLRHLFWPSAQPARSPTCPPTTPRDHQKVGGDRRQAPWGGGIAMNFLNAGIPVTMLEMKQEALDRGVATIRKNYEASQKGKLKQDKYEQRMALLTHAGATTT